MISQRGVTELHGDRWQPPRVSQTARYGCLLIVCFGGGATLRKRGGIRTKLKILIDYMFLMNTQRWDMILQGMIRLSFSVCRKISLFPCMSLRTTRRVTRGKHCRLRVAEKNCESKIAATETSWCVVGSTYGTAVPHKRSPNSSCATTGRICFP